MTLAEITEHLRFAADAESGVTSAMRTLVTRATADTAPRFAAVVETQERRAQAVGLAYAICRALGDMPAIPADLAAVLERGE